jgi:molecular chaperone DnaK (HSP70)
MSKIAGIDLGTTNSCIALPGTGKDITAVQVIVDEHGRSTTPSVVGWMSGKVIVGHLAKQRMGMKPEPIAFIKKYMGTDFTTKLGEEMVTPEQVSAHILKFLVDQASAACGEEIKDVIITVPDRFIEAAKQSTREAAESIGLTVVDLMQEPVAAAVAYGLDKDAAPGTTIFCYDLGGGTFDASILKKEKSGLIRFVAGDGVPDLGGFNFDRSLSNWILDQLKQSYSLDLNFQDPEDTLRFQKLMRIAEQVKCELSKDTNPEVMISEKEIFLDHDEQPVNIELLISRKQFEELILADVEETLEFTKQVFEKAQMKPEEVDEVIMVGGSSRIPLVQRKLQETLGLAEPPQLVDPDRSIARGAAMKAATMTGHQVEGLEFLTPLPDTHPLDTLEINARVTCQENANVTVLLAYGPSLEEEMETTTNEEGVFEFTDIPLEEDEENSFVLTVGEDPDNPLVEYKFSVMQEAEVVPDEIEVSNFIADDIKIVLTAGKLKTLIAQGTRVPCEVRVEDLKTAMDDVPHVELEIRHGNHVMGIATMEGIPPGVQKGSPILLTLKVSENRVISGKAVLLTTNTELDFEFQIPKALLPTVQGARDLVIKLDGEFRAALEMVPAGNERNGFFNEGNTKYLQQINRALDESPCDLTRANRLLLEFKAFVEKLARFNVLDPPLTDFEDLVVKVKSLSQRLISEQPDVAAKAQMGERLEGLAKMGRQAAENRNEEAWKSVNTQLNQMKDELIRMLSKNMTREEQIPHIKGYIGQLLSEVNNTLQRMETRGSNRMITNFWSRLEECNQEFHNIAWHDVGAAYDRSFDLMAQAEKLRDEANADWENPDAN